MLLVVSLVPCLVACGEERGRRAVEFSLAPGENAAAKAMGWLDDPDPERRMLALAVLAREPEAAQEAWPRLGALLDDQDPEVRRLAAALLPHLAPDRRAVRNAQLDRLRSEDPMKAETAAMGLLIGGYDFSDALPRLMEELRRESELPHRVVVRPILVQLVAKVGPAASGEVPFLLELMEHDPSLTSTIARALPKIVGPGDPQRDAVLEALRRLWDHDDPVVREAANASYDLIRYGPEEEEPEQGK